MSIYATLGIIGVKRFGDEQMIEIIIQSVPPHIDYAGAEWSFLPPPVDTNGEIPRAVLFVERGTTKGTERNGQEYHTPLLTLTGQEYQAITFADLLDRLEKALDVRYGQRPDMIFLQPDGSQRKIYPQE